MKFIRIVFAAILILAGLIGLLPYVFPDQLVPTGATAYDIWRALFFGVIGLGATAVLVIGLKGFKPETKKAYALLCAGAVMHAVGSSSAPILFLATTLNTTAIVLLSDLPYLIGSALIFTGVWMFAKQLGVKSWATNLKLFLPVTIVVVALSWLVPHAAVAVSGEVNFDALMSIIWAECCVDLFAVLILWKLRQRVSLPYAKAMTWLLVMATANLLASTMYLTATLANLYETTNQVLIIFTEVMGWMYIIHSMIFVIVSYSFAYITRGIGKVPEDNTIFGVIIYTASLSSSPVEKLDPLLDPLRQITSSYVPGQTLDEQTVSKLATLYQSLESFIIANDPVRNFSREEIRQRIQHKFDQKTYQPLFGS